MDGLKKTVYGEGVEWTRSLPSLRLALSRLQPNHWAHRGRGRGRGAQFRRESGLRWSLSQQWRGSCEVRFHTRK